MRILFAEAVAVEEEDMERMNRLVMKAIVQMVKATTGTRPGENDSSSLNLSMNYSSLAYIFC